MLTNDAQYDDRVDNLLTTQELAEYLQVPKKTVYAWQHRGGGPPGIRVGRYLRFRESDVQQWLDSRRGASQN